MEKEIAKVGLILCVTLLSFSVGVLTGINKRRFDVQLGIGILISIPLAALLYFF